MQTFESPGAARIAIMQFLMSAGPEIDASIKTKMMDLMVAANAVAQICGVTEYLYANQATVGTAGRDLAGSLAGFAGQHGWLFLRDGRGDAIKLAMMRENDEKPKGVTLPKSADDPAPLPEYAA